ncbi:hypothetical protein SAMN05443575_0370 [Jatrophihabitans endophyticus]|uniref:DUF2130 domain-containing protein n=1 Tax=Jatrophihabitans endophyticus TaxID=1206085 RepID=A0A1M5CVN2_9ACTN|nr:DUF2130 domain-containing protein [Jatrophihabitans endophyticus]SHF58769.1 hypothetical protein SAMN05443575_0370 [Jatrophihabitans endophyticus]
MTAHVSELPYSESCPWCGQGIPHDRMEEILGRIQANERAQTRSIERRLTAEMEQRLADAEAEQAVAIEAVQREADAAVTETRRKGADELAAAVAAAVAAAHAEAAQREAAAVEAANAARQAAEARLAEVTARHEEATQALLVEQREALEEHQEKLLGVERARAFAEQQKLSEQVAKLQRQLERKSANERGEGAELDLFEELRQAFPGDVIERVKRGQPGADIVHEIRDGGRVCGKIVYDSKDRTAWRNDYVSKLRSDQLAAEAEHAILATAVFPSGTHQLHVQEGVIVANPARVVELVRLLRGHAVRLATLRVGDEDRAEKATALYTFIGSERFAQLMEQHAQVTTDLLNLEVKEKRAHDTTWRRRGELIRQAEQNRGVIMAEIDQIVMGPDAGQMRDAT